MSTPEFSLDWPHGWQTRSGLDVQIFRQDARGRYGILGVISDVDMDRIASWTPSGKYDADVVGVQSWDLLNKPAPKREFWVNVYEGGGVIQLYGPHETEDKAKHVMAPEMCRLIARVKIAEGDGL